MVTVLLYTLIAVVSVQCIYYLGVFSNFAFAKKKKDHNTQQLPPVSLVICAKNEAENLKRNLPSFCNQKYSAFEIVLINDSSSDDTLEVMEGFAEKYNNIKIVNVAHNETFWGKKKYALTLGIKVTSHNYLIFSDADCCPASENWLTEMAGCFTNEKTIVLGYGQYKKVKKSFLNALIRFETLITAMQYFGMAKIGSAYMGVGRNLAYHKEEFLKHNGFVNHMHIKSGDDDLFVNEAATSKNVTISYTPDSFTISEPKTSFKNWIAQKRRHVSTAKHYKFGHQLTLGLFYISQILFWILTITLLSLQTQLLLLGCVIGFRFLIQYLVVGFSAKKLQETSLIWLLPLYECILICFQLFIFIANTISKPVDWK
ncbi:glycosyl transferase family 2 [Neptunitalea chrysea]|uniref:Glycosyl transferase family 2 n=1 Tax=Neptunitalea chrysea TaxID=1647581 RepID=A0A9W6B5N5_9FLAO|nr:glycosyltransferase [Neptunitalea chrysea]GLB52080.1 glycosyl transferase family 2 [Neptunitalea chrysea]